jgi:tetratricopeptide (TPR) repeat protein
MPSAHLLKTAASCLVVLSLFAFSCAAPPKKPLSAKPDINIAVDTARLAQEHYSLGRFRKALEIYSDTYDKHHSTAVRRGYVKMGEQIRSAADAAFQKMDYAEAGAVYDTLFASGITTRDFAQTLTFDDDYLEEQRAACSRTLVEIGLMRYREEKLEEAIGVWKKILVFDTENKDARNAIEKAAAQLQQLKNIK